MKNTMHTTDYILPYPYHAYTRLERRLHSFEEYKNLIYGWVKHNESSMEISIMIERAFSYVENTEYNNNIKKWFYDHLDKLKYIGDFSGLAFGIEFFEENKKISICFPYFVDEKHLYPGYDSEIFKNMDITDRLEWLNIHCEFIPFRIRYSDSRNFTNINILDFS